ncbi:CLUMA_CG012083, isoform A [Clunio marinus]|uniref:CLUMA_CG012083, isoform A n=1 Tax=Clunio marinus TaxID=568069 RepID=A0A1J1IFE8_9DIPT|nr:CLUMA_CG012083, isoform A [Clunio marinus]
MGNEDLMNNSKAEKHLEQKRKSKKIKKFYNLLDFVVVKNKNTKTQKIKYVKVSKQTQKRGKIRKKKITTIKKRILRERNEKKIKMEEDLVNQIDLLIMNEGKADESKCCDDLNNQFTELKVSEPVELNLSQESEEVQYNNLNHIQHSRNFREYCDHFITQDIKKFTELIFKDLFKFQENKFQQNPVKAKANKRYVVGFKEVKKFLIAKRLKLMFIAPDLARSKEVDAIVNDIKILAIEHNVPYVFSIKRRHIGYLLLKKVPVSIVGIFDYQGTTDNVNSLLKSVQTERNNYKSKIKGVFL